MPNFHEEKIDNDVVEHLDSFMKRHVEDFQALALDGGYEEATMWAGHPQWLSPATGLPLPVEGGRLEKSAGVDTFSSSSYNREGPLNNNPP